MRSSVKTISTFFVITCFIAIIALTASPAYADDGSVSIVTKDNNSAAYNAYQLFVADIDEENKATHVEWGKDVDVQSLVNFLNGYEYATWLTDNSKGAADNAQNAAEFIGGLIDKSDGTNDPIWVGSETFAFDFADWTVNESRLEPIHLESSDGQTQLIANEGYYLITSADIDNEALSATLPIWLPLGGSAHEVVVKAGTPSIEKHIVDNEALVDWCDVAIGNEITYQVTTTLPSHYHGFASYYYQVSDNVPAGMTVDTSKVTVIHGDTNITDQFVINIDQDNKLTITAEDLKALNEDFNSGDTITITYTVDLNDLDEIVFGGTGNINGATLTYSNDPYSDSNASIESNKSYVYTFQISLDKTDDESNTPLSGAKFIVKQENGGFLVKTGESFEWSASADDATQFTTDENGNIEQIPGLDAGTYTLTEVEVPDGYTESETLNTFTLDIEPTYSNEGVLEGITATVSNNDFLHPSIAPDGIDVSQGMINIDVTNSKSPTSGLFDKTGDSGAFLFLIAITASICIAVGILLWRKKIISHQN